MTKTSNQLPCRMVEVRVAAPACTLAALRTITPVIGNAPRKPHNILPPLRRQLTVVLRTPPL